jgi:hypothetical protein
MIMILKRRYKRGEKGREEKRREGGKREREKETLGLITLHVERFTRVVLSK